MVAGKNLRVAPELMRSILSHIPPTRFAMAYGSGIFAQKGYSADSKVLISHEVIRNYILISSFSFTAHARFYRGRRRFQTVAQGLSVSLIQPTRPNLILTPFPDRRTWLPIQRTIRV